MSEILIKAEHVSKKFSRSLKRSLWYGMQDVMHSLNPFVHDTDRESDAFKPKELRPGEFWALQDINFEVRRGECLGLIGHNGAGKSTLLKILNSLLRPDSGRITMKGRVGALIELSAGFNPILTGRENIYTQAALLGFSKSEVDKKFDAIVDFSELEDFLEMPLQNYSSGMKVKLGFAVSSQLEPDILLLDEVLAVGDVGFRAKCMQRMGELIDRCAVIFVSHSMPSVARVASTILHLHHGETKTLTTSLNEGMSSYYGTFSTGSEIRTGTGEVEVERITATCGGKVAENRELLEVNYGEAIEFSLECKFSPKQPNATIHILIWSQEMIPVLEILGPAMNRFSISPDDRGMCTVSTAIPDVTLNTGRYTVSVIVLSEDGMTCFRMLDRAIDLQVAANHGSGACAIVCAYWAAISTSATSLTKTQLAVK